eukprot:674000-Amphidinium_carterae.1
MRILLVFLVISVLLSLCFQLWGNFHGSERRPLRCTVSCNIASARSTRNVSAIQAWNDRRLQEAADSKY